MTSTDERLNDLATGLSLLGAKILVLMAVIGFMYWFLSPQEQDPYEPYIEARKLDEAGKEIDCQTLSQNVQKVYEDGIPYIKRENVADYLWITGYKFNQCTDTIRDEIHKYCSYTTNGYSRTHGSITRQADLPSDQEWHYCSAELRYKHSNISPGITISVGTEGYFRSENPGLLIPGAEIRDIESRAIRNDFLWEIEFTALLKPIQLLYSNKQAMESDLEMLIELVRLTNRQEGTTDGKEY